MDAFDNPRLPTTSLGDKGPLHATSSGHSLSLLRRQLDTPARSGAYRGPVSGAAIVRAISVGIGVSLACVVVLTGLSGRLDPAFHTECSMSLIASETNRWVPAALLNCPFGGSARVEAANWGWGAQNGTSTVVMMEGARADLFQLHDTTTLGIGPDAPCQQGFRVTLTPNWYGGASALIGKPSNVTDMGEPGTFAIFGETNNTSATVNFENGFANANQPFVSTCGGGGASAIVTTDHVTVGFPFDIGGQTIIGSYVIPWLETFTYLLPANFGTWAVENLSAPGGPGGGWAFDFLGGCS